MIHDEGHALGIPQEQSFFITGHATAAAIITQKISSTALILLM